MLLRKEGARCREFNRIVPLLLLFRAPRGDPHDRFDRVRAAGCKEASGAIDRVTW